MHKLKPGIDYVGISTPFYCIDGKGHLLMQKRSTQCRDEQGTWDCGSGELDFSCTIEENVLKELREEYGCTGKIVGQVPPHSSFREIEGVKTHWLTIPHFVLVNPNDVKIGEPLKIDEIKWFTLETLPTPLHSSFAFSLASYPSYFEKFLKNE